MKKSEIPPQAIIAVVALVVLIIGFFAYSAFLKPAPELDISKLSPERLADPDPPRVGSPEFKRLHPDGG